MASSARIDELRKKFDENPRRYFAPLANEFRKAGDPEQAVFICQEYLPQQPGHMSGHIVYGQALFELGRDEEAKAVFETALSLDPENLIALRHLGDIARQAGDLDVARFWYQRVLESDPRNEEITQVLMNLDATRGEPTRPALQEPPPIPAAEPSAPPLLEHAPAPDETIPQPHEETRAAVESEPESESYEPFEGFDRTIDFEQPTGEPGGEPEQPTAIEATADESVSERADENAPPMAEARPAEADAGELLDLEDFSIGGTPLGVPTIAEHPEVEAAAVGGSEELPGIEFSESEESIGLAAVSEQTSETAPSSTSSDEGGYEDEQLFGIGHETATFEPEFEQRADASAALSPEAEPEPIVELATDLALGLPPDEPEPPAVPSESGPAVEALEPADAAPMGAPVEFESAAEIESDASEEVFVTETMANLYVQQGHLANALEIYEKLLAHHPDDIGLQERIRDIKERIYGKPHESVWEPEPAAATTAAAASGPTIREYLRGVIAGRSAPPASNGSAPGPQSAAPPTESPAETITGSIDALFANSEPTAEDRSAANALAQAFGEWPEPTPIRGVPAHEASSELSLDHVFKANAPAPRREDADAFSFDQFFSEELGQASSEAQSQPGRESGEPSDDIAQFNAWLNGLKKT